MKTLESSLRAVFFKETEVDRSCAASAALSSLGCELFLDHAVISSMPLLHGGFNATWVSIGREVDFADVPAELRKHGRELIQDPIGVIAANQKDNKLSSEYPNGTQWQDREGNWCFVAFKFRYGKPVVHVGKGVDSWTADWFFPTMPLK